ncbi:hypothetical protein DY023_12225 [Microbacterium bovistercoris]|uniref:Activator of Hsp90 ATPase homologue 1/2-like C-terminal domain-containing protein n=1 Tax=Microbacterium bovistercoris TaxID=2293570 RepID=A0A371NS26_9MICO|nr:SRPBCC domain-containing protein [Microbacterium bovistercoris]REJ05006.1 hypothetical protein DY023_12225 [Microbacterium bovistercoris]
MNIIGTMRTLDETRGAIRVEDLYDTDVDDLWDACTAPDRLARWIAQVSGDPQPGATVQATFTSTWAGALRIDACEKPHHLLLTAQPGTDEEGQIEVWLTAEGARTRLIVEERGLPIGELPFHGGGWQAHLEDLKRSLELDGPAHEDGWSEREPAAIWHSRWTELTPAYRNISTFP